MLIPLALVAGLALAEDAPAAPPAVPILAASALEASALAALAPPFPENACGGLTEQALGDLPTAVLADRLRLRLPADAYTSPVPTGMMSAPVPDEATSLLYLEAGSDRMGLIASETWQVSGPNFEAAVHRVLTDLPEAGAPWIIQPLPTTDPSVSAIAWWPNHLVIDGTSDVHALDVLVADPTGAVIHLSWLLDAATAQTYGLGCTGLAARLSATAVPGPRPLPLGADDANIPVSTRHSVHLNLPADTAIFSQPGPDFAVYYILPLVPVDQATSSLGVYVGASPQEISPGNRPDRKGRLLGEKGTWVVAEEGGEGGVPALYRLERIVALKEKKSDGPPLYVHVFIAAATPADRDALVGIAESMSWVKARPSLR